jgi:NADH dehydrogenase [ubiquinone] 1 alpha subcomplex assembly factor 7
LTPLGQRLVALITAEGPIGVDRFMAAALGDPEHGYYMTRDPFGLRGDFTTAPEISPIFGEIIGAWLAEQWRQMAAPPETLLIELGPGRGTLAADIVRAAAVLPAWRRALRLHLVETSPVLRQIQAATLAEAHPDLAVTWHATIDTVPAGPFLLVANEFFDALPIRQWIGTDGRWAERRIGLNADGALAFVIDDATTDEPAFFCDADGIFETCPLGCALASAIGRRLVRDRGNALVIDYGHRARAVGETLQAVQRHRYTSVLDAPGEADLTAHVDFAALGASFRAAGASVWGPVSQRDFLIANGALLRLTTLERRNAVAGLHSGVDRLLDPQGMGTLFQVTAATSPGLPRPSGL